MLRPHRGRWVALSCAQVAAVKWMLHETMGSRQTFELRRKELAELGGEDVSEVTDQDVARSFKDLASPSAKAPLYLEYLELAQVRASLRAAPRLDHDLPCVFARCAALTRYSGA